MYGHWTNRPAGPFEIVPIRALINAHHLLGGEAFSRMLSLMAGAWQGAPNSLKASMLSGMALSVKTYETFLLVAQKPMSPAFITGRTGSVLNVYIKPQYRRLL